MATTTKPPRWRYSLMGALALIALTCVILALFVSTDARRRKLAGIRARNALQEGKEILLAHTQISSALPAYFADFDNAEFLNQHFEIRRGATVNDVAQGVPAVQVKSTSQWLLYDPAIAAELGRLNTELSAACRELQASR